MENQAIKIMGSEWNIIYYDLVAEYGADYPDGTTDPSTRTISINTNNLGTLKDYEERQKETLRHEIIHAFLFESGLGFNYQRAEQFGHDETMVDWFALQAPKIFKTYQELGLL